MLHSGAGRLCVDAVERFTAGRKFRFLSDVLGGGIGLRVVNDRCVCVCVCVCVRVCVLQCVNCIDSGCHRPLSA